MSSDLIMRRATAADAERVLEILEDGKRSIARFGIEQWQQGYPNSASVAADIAHDACWIAEDASSAPLGTLALRFDEDPEYLDPAIPWLTPATAPGADPAYAALHRCATAASALRRGVMGFMFSEAERLAREAGRASVRIDTHPGNRAMRSFLARRGYTELVAFELKTKGGAEVDLTRIAYEKLV